MKTTIEATTVAAIIRPGVALFGEDLLDLTAKAWEAGVNLSGAWIRQARFYPATGGVMVEGGNEDKHFTSSGTIEN